VAAKFIHLHLHTEYSIVDGIVRIKPLIEAVSQGGMPAVAVTDHTNLFATVKFYRGAIDKGIKPLFGSEVFLDNPDDHAHPFSLVLLCQNKMGYQHLTRLVSRAYTEGQTQGRVVIQPEWLEGNTDGLIALSGGKEGDVGHALLADKHDIATTRLNHWKTLFPERFYLELQRTEKQGDEQYIHQAIGLAAEHNIPVVATNDVRFIDRDDFEAHEARVCINQGNVLNDPRRPHSYTQQQYLKSPEEMAELFADIPEALENTVEIARRCTLDLELGKSYLPDFPTPDGLTVEDFLGEEAKAGLKKRLQVILKQDVDVTAKRKPYEERLALELDVINTMGYPGYFLIVADFIRWAKENGVPVGPGRGSGAGSLVAYVLGITDLDPLEYELLFERFLNPERVSMPDFDVDFCMEGRDRVIDYVAEKYGRESVSQIITYGTMAAKAVVRDVGRVLGHPYGFVDKLAKMIPFEIGMTLDKALSQEEDLRNKYNDEEEVRTLIDLAKKLEGVTRNAGKHAGGVVIAPSKLTDFSPLYCEEGGENLVTQFDKDDVEAIGLVKFDFLGLRTLTIIDWALKTIKEKTGKAIDISMIPTDDEKPFELLKACQTTAVFQLESRGMKDLIKRLQPDCFDEIIALVALFRPGPLQSGMVDDFIDRKHGRAKVEYPHPELEPILSPTYGVILYQEQVMQIAQVLAGYTLGGADLLRRAMGKKKPEEMAKQRTIFIAGATNRGVKGETATYIFNIMEKFAGYGFNKSHSAAYALIAYQTAWLKAHYPAAFMAAVLSSDMDNTDKVVNFVDECKAMGLEVIPPHINRSHYKFTVENPETILYGLGAIKGVGEAAIESIIAAREQEGEFTHLFNLCERVDLRKVNKRVLEALVKSSAVDSLGPHRGSLFENLENATKSAEQHIANRNSGQVDLFGSLASEEEANQPQFQDTSVWKKDEMLKGEKETLGLYLSGHPMDRYKDEIAKITTAPIGELNPQHMKKVRLGGFIVATRTMFTKRGDRMAFITLDDNTGRMEVTIFSDVYDTAKPIIVKDQLVIVDGEVSPDEFTGGYRISAKSVLNIEQARNRYSKGLRLKLDDDPSAHQLMDQLISTLKPFAQGPCPVTIEYQKNNAIATLLLGEQWRVRPCDQLFDELTELLGDQRVEMAF